MIEEHGCRCRSQQGRGPPPLPSWLRPATRPTLQHRIRFSKTLKDLGDKVDGADRAACETAINDLWKNAVKGEDKAADRQRAYGRADGCRSEDRRKAQPAGRLRLGSAQAGAQQQAGGAGQQQANKGDDDVVDADYTEVKH